MAPPDLSMIDLGALIEADGVTLRALLRRKLGRGVRELRARA